MKRILVEWFHRATKGPGNSGSDNDAELIKSTIEAMRPFMRTMQVQLDFREVALTGDDARCGDAVEVNGRTLGEQPPAERAGSIRPSRSCAAPDTPGATSFPGTSRTDLSEMLVDAILKESGRFARGGCGCSPDDLLR